MAADLHSQASLLKTRRIVILEFRYLSGIRAEGVAVSELRSPLKVRLEVAITGLEAESF
jgi:hypothetical protein